MSQRVSLRYIQPLEIYAHERPYSIFDDVPEGTPSSNLKIVQGPEQLIEDAREAEAEFDLDIHGFSFRAEAAPPGLKWDRQVVIESIYIPSVRSMLERLLGGVRHCEPFDWRVRAHSNLVHPLLLSDWFIVGTDETCWIDSCSTRTRHQN